MRSKALLFALLLSTTLTVAQQAHKPMKRPGSPVPDKAYAQKIWDAWATLDPANPAQYYAQGPHVFYDIAPVKYSSWDEYQKGVAGLVATYKSASFGVNDDFEVHPIGNIAWGTATVKSDMVAKTGLHEMSTMRWTFVMENQGGKWLLIHEHVSEPLH